jgi:hypothetical protein
MASNAWPGLELRYLADRLGYTQSAVSQQVAAL